ncbi:MAG: 1-acyl-sn-glycerol-3-phosphate acyltransferase [Actinomycetota bacterium]|nr:1-acyl-sn-glycerol-3-phosphate acyltransferase [Actinomycetota bacterium]
MTYWLVKVVMTPLLYGLFRVKVTGREHVPKDGPVILAANHQSFIDSVFLPLVVRRRVTFIAKSEYFESWKTAWFFRAVGMIPMKREGGNASLRALVASQEVLAAGGVLGIYPEGTRSPDGRLYKGHTGVARLAVASGAAVVPVAIAGTSDIQPIGVMMPRLFRRVSITFGPPLLWSDRGPLDGNPGLPRKLTNELMVTIAELSGREHVGEYAKRNPTARAAVDEL